MNRPMQAAQAWRWSPARTHLALLNQSHVYPLLLIALTFVGFFLRLKLVHAFPFREDEAIYGYWARAAVSDPFFLQIWPDKPPLFIWLLTGTFAVWGPSEAAARLVSIFAATLTIPLVAMGAERLWHSRTAALVAALVFTFSPFAISFAPTAYTDSLLVLCGAGAVVLALGGNGLGAGLLLGAACMTKQQGLFYVPLVVGLLSLNYHPTRSPVTPEGSLPVEPLPEAARFLRNDKPIVRIWPDFTRVLAPKGRHPYSRLAWFILGVALIVLPILWWDSQRWAVAPSPWELAQRNYVPLTWLPPDQWLARWDAWAKVLWFLGGSWSVWGMLLGAIAGAMLFVWRRNEWLLLFGWGIVFLLVHLISSVEVWDRYLLPLAPWLAWMFSGAVVMLWRLRMADWVRGLLFLLLVMGMAEFVYPSMAAARGEIPIGADHGDYAGLTEAIGWVEEQEGPAILYHQILGWHFRFYLYDELQPVGDNPPRFDLRWFSSAAYLADNAAKSPYPPKYLILPDWATPPDLPLHLALRNLAMVERLHVGRFAVVQILQPARPLCDWCKSALPVHSPASGGLPFSLYQPSVPVPPTISLPAKPSSTP